MPDALQEGTAAPTSVTASVPARPTRISPTTNQPRPQTIHPAPPNTPLTNLRHHGRAVSIAVSPWQTKRDRRKQDDATGNQERQHQQPRGRGHPPPPPAGSGRTQHRGKPGHPWPSRARTGLAKPPSPRCRTRATVATTPRTSHAPDPPETPQADQARPAQTQIEPKRA